MSLHESEAHHPQNSNHHHLSTIKTIKTLVSCGLQEILSLTMTDVNFIHSNEFLLNFLINVAHLCDLFNVRANIDLLCVELVSQSWILSSTSRSNTREADREIQKILLMLWPPLPSNQSFIILPRLWVKERSHFMNLLGDIEWGSILIPLLADYKNTKSWRSSIKE
jgi:hypothetical protein